MSRWFVSHRQQYIADMLRAFGQINRSTLVEKFQISAQQASADIALFLSEHPDVLIYDGRAKCYVVNTDALPAAPQPAEGEG